MGKLYSKPYYLILVHLISNNMVHGSSTVICHIWGTILIHSHYNFYIFLNTILSIITEPIRLMFSEDLKKIAFNMLRDCLNSWALYTDVFWAITVQSGTCLGDMGRFHTQSPDTGKRSAIHISNFISNTR